MPVHSHPEISAGACIDVYVHVLGDVIPNSTAKLFEPPSVEYDDVMNTATGNNSILTTMVSESQEFMIPCLGAGNYAIMIPISSYYRSVGYPLPVEFCNENLSIDIAFQGGNYLYAVGVFEISRREQNQTCEQHSD